MLQAVHKPKHDSRHTLHMRLLCLNSARLNPRLTDAECDAEWRRSLGSEYESRLVEGDFLEMERAAVQAAAQSAPQTPVEFIAWFETLREHGPGQGDPLFSWLETTATRDEMYWFLAQEAAGEAGFEDLVALAQLKMPPRPKLEMARNYWDEMGRGNERGMHGLMLAAAVRELNLDPQPADTVWESLALANLMAGLAMNRRYAYQAIGALGAIEMTAPSRVSRVNAGLKRLGAPLGARAYFQLHAGLDIKHSEAWNTEVLSSLVQSDPATARPLAEGALMRLAAGARCFERYRTELGVRPE